MKKRIISLILCAVLCVSLLPMSAFAIETIESVEMDFTVPVAGEVWHKGDSNVKIWGYGVSLDFFAGYSTSSEEVHDGDEFQIGEEYYAIAYFKANDGYMFSDNVTASVGNYRTETAIKGELLEVVVHFPPARWDVGTVYLRVTEPKAGEHPSYIASPESENYHVAREGVAWYEVDDENTIIKAISENDVFEAGKKYAVNVIVVCDDEQRMFTENTNGEVNFKPTEYFDVYNDTEGAVTFIFDALPESKVIDTVSVSLTAPKVGANPALNGTVPANANYKIEGVNWFSDEDGRSLTAKDKYEAGKTYILNVTVTALNGYDFVTDIKGTLNGNELQAMKYPDKVILTKYFTIPEIVIDRVDIGETGIAKENVSTITVDGVKKELKAYMILDSKGNGTNYMRLRDIAALLNGTNAQFDIVWTAEYGTNVYTHTPYTHPNGSEGNIPFHGDQVYAVNHTDTTIDGIATGITSFFITDANGGGHTFLQLRDFGKAFGFNVGYTAERGVFIETDKPYSFAD
ncbi:MAG: hypothetical protein IJP43_02935 [Oscillospiraceae bacterium]|nr:hypothetical protein [Oscillospiraceae bacterium]